MLYNHVSVRRRHVTETLHHVSVRTHSSAPCLKTLALRTARGKRGGPPQPEEALRSWQEGGGGGRARGEARGVRAMTPVHQSKSNAKLSRRRHSLGVISALTARGKWLAPLVLSLAKCISKYWLRVDCSERRSQGHRHQRQQVPFTCCSGHSSAHAARAGLPPSLLLSATGHTPPPLLPTIGDRGHDPGG